MRAGDLSGQQMALHQIWIAKLSCLVCFYLWSMFLVIMQSLTPVILKTVDRLIR